MTERNIITVRSQRLNALTGIQCIRSGNEITKADEAKANVLMPLRAFSVFVVVVERQASFLILVLMPLRAFSVFVGSEN